MSTKSSFFLQYFWKSFLSIKTALIFLFFQGRVEVLGSYGELNSVGLDLAKTVQVVSTDPAEEILPDPLSRHRRSVTKNGVNKSILPGRCFVCLTFVLRRASIAAHRRTTKTTNPADRER